MKRRPPLSLKQSLLAILCFLLFTLLTIFAFTWHRDEKRFSQITSRLFVEEMTASTLNMHYTIASPGSFGIHNYKPVLPIYSAADNYRQQAAAENLLTSLSQLKETSLPSQDQYTLRLLTLFLENSIQQNAYPYYAEPLAPSSGMQSQLPILLAEYTFRTRQDVTDYLALLDQTDDYFASLLTFEQEKAKAGLLQPAFCLEKVKNQCDTIVTKEDLNLGEHFLQTTFAERLAPLYKSGELNQKEVMNALAENDRLLKTVLLPAYEKLADGLFLLEDPSIPLAGLAAKPEGMAYYEHLLISETGSRRPIPQIQKLLSSVFNQEYERIHALVDENPTISEHLSSREYEVFPYKDATSMLVDLQNRMKGDFPPLEGSEHSLPLVTIKAVSTNLEKYCAPAFYLTAPLDDTDNNVIYINELNSPSGLELYTTLAHEGYPGHLYQTVYSNRYFTEHGENNVRQLLRYSGYQEGWAVYVEFLAYDYASELMREQGRPQDAICIQLEKHNRSLQLCLYSLLDLMIHYEDTPYSKIAKVLEHFGVKETSSAKAVYTYIAEEPCNYLKYYLGYLEILDLKTSAEAIWGDDYSDLAFHRFFLDCGPSDFNSLRDALTVFSLPDERID